MGVQDFDAQKVFEAVYKMQTTPATRVGGGDRSEPTDESADQNFT